MEGKQADPSRNMNRVLVWVIPVLCNLIRNIMDDNYCVEKKHHDENNKKECEIIKKHGIHSKKAAFDRLDCYKID